ncbi:MAG: hypothetical protein ACOC24_04315 [Desulfovibrionales bacterium]
MASKKLKEIFDNCSWKEKFLDSVPENPDEIRYKWTEEDAEYARPFFTVGLLTEETPAVRRSLYFGKDKQGVEILCVREITHEDFDAKEVGREMARMMDISKIKEE